MVNWSVYVIVQNNLKRVIIEKNIMVDMQNFANVHVCTPYYPSYLMFHSKLCLTHKPCNHFGLTDSGKVLHDSALCSTISTQLQYDKERKND